jgi:hypothetical protein
MNIFIKVFFLIQTANILKTFMMDIVKPKVINCIEHLLIYSTQV